MNHLPVLDETQMQKLREWGGEDLQRRIVGLFLAHAGERVRQIREGLSTQDGKLAETGAHTLKSSAGNVGARRLQQLASDAEAMAETGELGELQGLFPSLEREFRSACEALRAVMEDLTG
jgi:two-component system, sensor histidine kinase and response regulator